MGNDSLLAFFEIPKGEKIQTDRDALGGMQHVAFAVSSGQFDSIQARLTAHGVDFDGPVQILPGLYSIYFYDPNIPEGIIGILASKIKDYFNKPCIVLTNSGKKIKGSARSVSGLHIRDALDALAKRYPHLMNKFGGDAMAAGVSMATIPTMSGMIASLSGMVGTTYLKRKVEFETRRFEDSLLLDH
mgnify:CR=1 FL=1